MGRDNLSKLRGSLVKLRLTIGELEDRHIGVQLALTKLDNQLSSVGVALADFGSTTRMNEFGVFMESLSLIRMNLSNKCIDVDCARRQLIRLSQSKLFSYI